MYCPKCGDELTEHDGELCCAVGDMSLSQKLEEILTQRYSAGSESVLPATVYDRQIHGGLNWFCPGCGIRLNEELHCESCRKHIRDSVRTLVELHPHARNI